MTTNNTPPAPNNRRNVFIMVGILVVLALLAGCAYGVSRLFNRGEGDNATANTALADVCAMAAENGVSLAECNSDRSGASTTEDSSDGPTWVVIENGREVEKPFPQTEAEFVAAIASECTQLEHDSGCVYLTEEMVTPIRNDEDVIVGWELLFERNGQGMFYEWTVIDVPSASMQYGAMREFELRARCGLTPEEIQQLGYIDDMIGYALPGNSERLPVEGASFYADQSEQLGQLDNQTWSERCAAEPKPEIIEGVGGDESWTPDYSMEAMLAEFGLQDEYDSGTIVVSDEPGACWHVNDVDGATFELHNTRGQKLDGWIPPEVTGIEPGYQGPVHGFSVCAAN